MNNIREIERLNQRELDAAVPISASWHNDWNDTAYVYIGGLPYELSEGDIVTIFSQYGEPVHINLIRDKDTGKSKGFAFLKYEDQRSTVLAVDNLGGTNILGRTIRVDHCRYKQRDDETDLFEVKPAAGEEECRQRARGREAGARSEPKSRRRRSKSEGRKRHSKPRDREHRTDSRERRHRSRSREHKRHRSKRDPESRDRVRVAKASDS
ncbi:hypothetical protein FN846DRAFT_781686 [Sphaerosporella brunnea]|uniref:RRM domain-containing protein n=1 Tax=Sphaerosporella brunnea TaxID=1250544 RepID=A0A5J5ERL2_9PEZI|nr:hypothetical protein FN846DRAFT_781686 [Sphaerosporella brunnea]